MSYKDAYVTPRGEQPQVPIATTIKEQTIVDAVVYGDRGARTFIREYGRLQDGVLRSLIRTEPR